MRLILIPGFGEDSQIFSKILPFLDHPTLLINLWDNLETARPLSAKAMAIKLIETYGLQSTDVIIGHSMGGWIGLHIKESIHCLLVHVSSWTDPAKVKLPIQNKSILYWLTRNGWYINRLTRSLILHRYYKNLPSKGIMEYTLNHLIRQDRKQVEAQLRLILEPVSPCLTEPDLRIHTLRDPIVGRPDQEFYLVPGDHFAIYTFPEDVAKGISTLLFKGLL